MIDDLYRRIEAMDWSKPYVWRLKISSSEFAALEAAVAAGETTARQNVVYLAEWYKRRYDGGGRGATALPVLDFDCRKLFEEAGVGKANLFVTENGHSTWQYSLYVLGGVAMAFEQGKRDSRFLKELCRIYYGEDRELEDLDIKDRGRAVAFRESVRTRGCLYEFLKAVLEGFRSGEFPFAADDLADKNSATNLFLERIKRANDAVLKSKFEIEWVIGFDPAWAYATRKLRLSLKPESLGGLNHRYLGYERVRQWEIVPETCKRLVVGVRFLTGEVTVKEPDFDVPLLDFLNTGDVRGGFVALGPVERYSFRTDAPVMPFDRVEIVVRDDSRREHVIESMPIGEWVQVFRSPEGYHEWTSRHAAQRDSLVILPMDCAITDYGQGNGMCWKPFHIKGGDTCADYQFCPIYDKVAFRDGAGREHVLYNRQGYDQITVRLHHECLRYHDGQVSCTEELDEDVKETLLQIVFGKDDLIVRHFETKNDLSESGTDVKSVSVEFLEGRDYREWTDENAPSEGKVVLRLKFKGVERKLVAYYLPQMIRRDCVKGEILIGDTVIKDVVSRNGAPTEPVFHKSVGADGDFVSLEIWRATKHKEIIRDGRVVRYVEDGEEAEISYALKDGLSIRDFGVHGYCEYDCTDITGIYREKEFSPRGDGHLSAYENGAAISVCERLDARAPAWLFVNLAKKFDKTPAEKLLYWDYLPTASPREVADDSCCQGNDLVFHDLKDYGGTNVLSTRVPEPNPFAFADNPAEDDTVLSFDVATKHGLYYFLMQPLREAFARDGLKGLREEIKVRHGGSLTEADERGLARLAEEFGMNENFERNAT